MVKRFYIRQDWYGSSLYLHLRFLFFGFLALLVLPACQSQVRAEPPPELHRVPFDSLAPQLALDRDIWSRREEMMFGAIHNLLYLRSGRARSEYVRFEEMGVSRDLVARSLFRFYQILRYSNNFEEFQGRLRREFALYRSPGNDGQGTVKFTAYFRPVYKASRTKTAQYRYPIYQLPEGFVEWSKPHPTRVALEGYDGLGNPGTLMHGQELAWLSSRYEAFMIHLQGSAILEFTDGGQSHIAFAAGTAHPFRGVPKSVLRKHNVRWDRLGEFFTAQPDIMNEVLSRNNRFIFFKEAKDPRPIGSLGVPVIGERSIATDKLKLPPGALGVIRTRMPVGEQDGELVHRVAARLVLDHDTGSAIKGPGRVDIYMGTGPEAMKKASSVYGNGELYYLFLREYSDYSAADRT